MEEMPGRHGWAGSLCPCARCLRPRRGAEGGHLPFRVFLVSSEGCIESSDAARCPWNTREAPEEAGGRRERRGRGLQSPPDIVCRCWTAICGDSGAPFNRRSREQPWSYLLSPQTILFSSRLAKALPRSLSLGNLLHPMSAVTPGHTSHPPHSLRLVYSNEWEACCCPGGREAGLPLGHAARPGWPVDSSPAREPAATLAPVAS